MAEDAGQDVAVYGGSFNPPHVAHVLAVAYARSVVPVDRVLVVPVYRHPFAKEVAPFERRLAMCRLAFEWIPGCVVSDVEAVLGGESRTLRTLEHLTLEHPEWRLRLLVGADVLADLPKWHRFDKIAELAPPIVLGRMGIEREPAPTGPSEALGLRAPEPVLPRVSSTEIRAAFAAGDLDSIRALVPASVLAYAVEYGLYTGAGGQS